MASAISVTLHGIPIGDAQSPGRLATADIVTDDGTDTILYTVPTLPGLNYLICSISLCNRADVAATNVSIAISSTDIPTDSEFIEYNSTIVPKGVLERTQLVASVGDRIIIRVGSPTVSPINDMTISSAQAKWSTTSYLTGSTDPFIELENPMLVGQPYTVEAWVYHESTPGTDQTYLTISSSDDTEYLELDTQGIFRTGLSINGGSSGAYPGFPLANSTWHHVVFAFAGSGTFDSSDYTVAVDGVLLFDSGFSATLAGHTKPFTKITWRALHSDTVSDGWYIDNIRLSAGDPYSLLPATTSYTVPSAEATGGLEVYPTPA
jgi:hypothetical protein